MYCYHCMSELPDGSGFCPYCRGDLTVQSAPHHLAAGTVLNGRYLIGEVLGEGGFGITYIGLDLNLKLKIAVKEFYPHGYANRNHQVTDDVFLNHIKETTYFQNAKEQFLREAQNIAMFSKEHAVVDVRDYFTANNTAYIVMEYVDGMTLSEHLSRYGVFGAEDIVTRMLPLMDALIKMHDKNVIHRDISPDNIMITDDGSLKLMDFGSARYYAGDNKRTMSVILKPGYAPPEQYSAGGSQGPWTDVYGLCATLYKCITGKTPDDAMSRSLQDGLQSPSAFRISVSPAVENVLMTGLRLNPGDRYQDIRCLKAAFREAISLPPGVSDRNAYAEDCTVIADQQEATPSVRRSYGDTGLYSGQTPGSKPDKHFPVLPLAIGAAVLVTVICAVIIIVVLSLRQPEKSSVSQAVSQAESRQEMATAAATEAAPSAPSATEPVTEAPEKTEPPAEKKTFDVDSEVEHIRALYYATQEDPGTLTEYHGAAYYTDNGSITKIICPGGYRDWGYSRNYFYDNGKLYFAFVYDGTIEHRLYFADGTLIRYIDDKGTIMNYGDIDCDCPMQSRVVAEAAEVLEDQPAAAQPVWNDLPYLIKVFPSVDIYEAPGSTDVVVMTLDEENIYTIVDEKYIGSTMWGKLKSGVGWIRLDDVYQKGGYIIR